MKRRPLAFAWLLPLIAWGLPLLASPPGTGVLPSPPAPPISGVVSHLQSPIAGAVVIFYNIGDASLSRSRTADDGTFVLPAAPVGVYDLVAYKRGFLPALVRLWHQAVPSAVSAVRIQLSTREPAVDSRPSPSSVWDLRGRLPADVWREIELEDAAEAPVASDRVPMDRPIGGEVRTVADVSAGDTSLSRTDVGVRGGLPNGWQYDLRGQYAAVSDTENLQEKGTTTGNSSGFALDVATSPLERLSLTTRRNTVSFRDDGAASLQTHALSWSRNSEEGYVESVGARYIEEANLYRASSLGTSFFPLASRTWEVKARYARPADDSPGVAVAMTYRHREGTVGPSGVASGGAFFLSAPDADLAAAAAWKLSSRAQVEGGVVARYLSGGYGIAPRVTARYDLGNGSSLFVRGLYRVADSDAASGTVLPLVASIEDNGDATSRQGFTVGLARRTPEGDSFRLEVSDQKVTEAVRAFFEGDFLTDFDSVYLFDGNSVRQYQASANQRLSDRLSGSVAVRYGSIGGEVAERSASRFGIATNRGHFWSARAAVEIVPTRTGFALLVRGVRQDLETPAVLRANDSDKVAISIAQDLAVVGLTPFGSVCKLLLALESARSTAATDREDPPQSHRLLGGLSVAF